MTVRRLAGVVIAASLLAGAGLVVASADAAEKKGKTPPACGAISFRAAPAGLPDGEHDAGMYKSRFGLVELRVVIRGGLAVDHYMQMNGQRLPALSGGVPKGTDSCLKSKHVAVPAKTQSDGCTGTRFRVVLDRSGNRKVAMLFGLHGSEWQFCSASAL